MAEEKYVIEGTIYKIYVDESDNLSFSIMGTEGYSVKQGKDKYNLLCPEKLKDEINDKSKTHVPTILISQEYQFSVSEKNKELVIKTCSSNKRISMTIALDEKKSIDKLFADKNLPLKVSSLVILSD